MSDYTQGNSFYESDSFESDSENHKNIGSRKATSSQPIPRKTEHIYRNFKQVSGTAKNRQRNNNRKMMPQKRFTESQLEVTAQRILSARKHKITDQNNLISELQKQIDDLLVENKTLKSQTYRQDKALSKIDSRQSDIPKILEQHQAEVTNLKEQLKRTKDLLNNEMKQRKESDSEALKLRNSLTKANQLIFEKNLGERNILQLQLVETQEKLESSEKSLEVTSKHLENLEKSHKREIYNLRKQLKQYEVQCRESEKELDLVKINLKEKEKLLEIQNIYSHRIKMPHRIPGSGSDRHACSTCLGVTNDQLLDKLNFNNLNGKSNPNKINYSSNQSDVSSNSRYLDPEKIKDDIRRILEEEILSGRIKPIESQMNYQSPVLPRDNIQQEREPSPELALSTHDSFNTGRAVESEIFDKEPQTQIESVNDGVENLKEDLEKFDRDQKQKQILLSKLSAIDQSESTLTSIESTEKADLKYSYPNDKDFVENDLSINEIETIPAIDIKKPTKTSYKFNETIENLHQGIPVNVNNSDVNFRRRTSDSKRMPTSAKSEAVQRQIEASMSQKNNSNLDQAADEVLPPLTESERLNKERNLMSELFGETQTNGTFKSRKVNLLWDQGELVDRFSHTNPTNISSRDFNKSEDLEEILL